MTELVPLSEHKRISFNIDNAADRFRWDTDQVTAEMAQEIAEHVQINLYLGSHGTQADDYLAVEKVFDAFDPAHTVVCFENASFSTFYEKEIRQFAQNAPTSERMRMQREAVLNSRNSHGANYLASTDAFLYAQQFCIANGFDTRFVDIDAWMTQHWYEYMRDFGGIVDDSILDEVTAEFLSDGWQEQPFISSAVAWFELHNKATVFLDNGQQEPTVIYRWREFHRLREEAVANRVNGLALELAEKRKIELSNGNNVPLMQIAIFFGAAHRRGLQERLSTRGLSHTVTPLAEGNFYASANDVPLNGEDVHAFANAWVNGTLIQLYGDQYSTPEDIQLFADKRNATIAAMDQLPLSAIQDLYEAYRTFTAWHQSEKNPRNNLERALQERRLRKLDPQFVFTDLINQMFTKANMNINQIIQDYTNRRMQSTNELFGRLS